MGRARGDNRPHHPPLLTCCWHHRPLAGQTQTDGEDDVVKRPVPVRYLPRCHPQASWPRWPRSRSERLRLQPLPKLRHTRALVASVRVNDVFQPVLFRYCPGSPTSSARWWLISRSRKSSKRSLLRSRQRLNRRRQPSSTKRCKRRPRLSQGRSQTQVRCGPNHRAHGRTPAACRLGAHVRSE